MLIVIATSITRAEADNDLARIYIGNKDGNKRFVEGNPYDKVWGVGISWEDRRIYDERN